MLSNEFSPLLFVCNNVWKIISSALRTNNYHCLIHKNRSTGYIERINHFRTLRYNINLTKKSSSRIVSLYHCIYNPDRCYHLSFYAIFYFFQLRRPSQEIADDRLNNFEHTNYMIVYCQI
jgi:hypothetical protein